MEVIVRESRVGDAAEIAGIYGYYVENSTATFDTVAPDAEVMADKIENILRQGFPFVVAERIGEADGNAEEAERIVGFAYAHLWKEKKAYQHTWESTVYVATGLESNGIGGRLMAALVECAKSAGCHSLIACITAENTESRRFHENIGFRQVSEFHEVGFKYGRYLDVVDYELLLGSLSREIESKMALMRDNEQTRLLMGFFKCGEGEYGEGDRFLGLRTPQTRSIVMEYRNRVHLSDARELLLSPWHEVRLAGLLLMVEIYKREKKRSEVKAREVVDCYLASLDSANNWDLVDLSAPYILGDWLLSHPADRDVLYRLSEMRGKLWHQRVAMVATWMLIRNGEFSDTFLIAEKYLSHSHDLIHKATGWMLREVGKRGGYEKLCEFLDKNAPKMPRTMLRYAIEKFPADQRSHYMNLK